MNILGYKSIDKSQPSGLPSVPAQDLYHLNAEEEPEGYFYPKDPEFKKKYGPRGVIQSSADGKINDTGPLNTKRMETVDEEFLTAAKDFIERQTQAKKPFFAWFNTTRMHVFTHLKADSYGKTGKGIHADGMVEHDGHVGQLLDCWTSCRSPTTPSSSTPTAVAAHHRNPESSEVIDRLSSRASAWMAVAATMAAKTAITSARRRPGHHPGAREENSIGIGASGF